MKKVNDLPRVNFCDLQPIEQQAVRAAKEAWQYAYAPYSGYKVGVSVVASSGKIYTGVNVENAHYKVGHAEEYALGDMVKHGERRFTILVCVAKNGGIPCMSCRQAMREFSGEDLEQVTIIGVGTRGKLIRCTFADIVGVDSFGPGDLGIVPEKF